jgi:hypothetical protein
MKFGIRKPSLRKSVAARTSPARIIRHSVGLKAPRGAGGIFSPRRAAYNYRYHRSTFGLGAALSLVPSLFLLYFLINYFWMLVFASVVVILILGIFLCSVRFLQSRPIVKRGRKFVIEHEDYSKWSQKKWESWKTERAEHKRWGRLRDRPKNTDLWTPQEIEDWKKEEWLRLTEEGPSEEGSSRDI